MFKPIISYNFRVTFGEGFEPLSKQVSQLEVDFIRQTIDLKIIDCANEGSGKALMDWLGDPIAIDWIMLGSKGEPIRSHIFEGLRTTFHTVAQSSTMTEAEAVTHTVQVQFKAVEISYA